MNMQSHDECFVLLDNPKLVIGPLPPPVLVPHILLLQFRFVSHPAFQVEN